MKHDNDEGIARTTAVSTRDAPRSPAAAVAVIVMILVALTLSLAGCGSTAPVGAPDPSPSIDVDPSPSDSDWSSPSDDVTEPSDTDLPFDDESSESDETGSSWPTDDYSADPDVFDDPLDPTPERLDGSESYEFEPDDLERAENASDAVEDYCSGAVSEAQYVGCLSHVTDDDIWP